MEGKKVREIAIKLAVSEADLYRKQKVAIEKIADILVQMEMQATGRNPEKTIIDRINGQRRLTNDGCTKECGRKGGS
jgi:hypothetical protein